MRRILTTLFIGCLAVPLLAQDAPKKDDPQDKKPEAPKTENKEGAAKTGESVEILKKADEATKNVKLIRYEYEYKGLGESEARLPVLKGTAVMGVDSKKDNSNLNKHKYHVEVKGKAPNGDAIEFTAGFDGENYYFLDPKTKTAHVDMDPAVLGRAQQMIQNLGGGMLMLEYVYPTPFSDEINGESKLKDATKVGDEECYQIAVAYKQAGQEATWFFSKKDFLPRRVDRVISGPNGKRIGSHSLTSLAVDPKFVADPFKMNLPEGYKKTDEPAP